MDELVVAVGREGGPRERRVALVPDQVRTLCGAGLAVRVESGAGTGAWFGDGDYGTAGAEVVDGSALAGADVLVAVGRPPDALVDALRPGAAVVGLLAPLTDPQYVKRLAQRGLTAISLDGLPRTLSRAQPMDALTSQASVAGYKAVLVAANLFGRYFPLLVTAAGTARPARVLVLGAGVAGLQAMATARRLGATVSGYDIRPQSRAEVESVGATFLDLPSGPPPAAADGYAPALDEQQQRTQQDALAAHVARHDVVITTAQVPGRRPPLLVGEDAVKAMDPGSVIVDLAAGPDGGNVALSEPGETVLTEEGVTIVGAPDLAAAVPTAASTAYSRNVCALLLHLIRDGRLAVDLADEIQAGVVLTHEGRVVHPTVAHLLGEGEPV